MMDDDDSAEGLQVALLQARDQHERDLATIDGLRRDLGEYRRETQHQIRNILSVVRSIARRTVADDETAEEYQARLDSRLASFTNLQSDLLRDPRRGVDLCSLIDKELMAFGIKLDDKAHVDGPAVRLAAKPASILGLAFHELARMAIECGASASLDGSIDVRWSLAPASDDSEGLDIVWVETGRHPRGESSPDPAFGREVIEQAVAYEVGGGVDLDVTADGLRCRFALPASCMAQPNSSGIERSAKAVV